MGEESNPTFLMSHCFSLLSLSLLFYRPTLIISFYRSSLSFSSTANIPHLSLVVGPLRLDTIYMEDHVQCLCFMFLYFYANMYFYAYNVSMNVQCTHYCLSGSLYSLLMKIYVNCTYTVFFRKRVTWQMAVLSGRVSSSVMMHHCQTNVYKVVHTRYEEKGQRKVTFILGRAKWCRWRSLWEQSEQTDIPVQTAHPRCSWVHVYGAYSLSLRL